MSEEQINLESLETLLPDTEETESKKVYLKTLKWALENKDIKNLAITGTYGSGKSSILKTFWNAYDKKEKVLEISAATFSEEKEFSRNPEGNEETEESSGDYVSVENVLEQHITQQMFYKVKPEKIPLSRFTRIHNENSWETFWNTLLFLFSFLLVSFSIKYEWLTKLFTYNTSENFNSMNLFIFIVLLLIGILILSFAIFRAVKVAKNLRLSTFGIGNATFELKADKDNTVFNKYLDEIIYFFSQTGINVVVFEDLDRFNNLNIFERLRGLNHILNQSEELKGENIIFVYALKDDIFSENDNFQEVQNRTKFFDFIIPTVKIMHSSNSESVLLSKLKRYIKDENAHGEEDGVSKKLITDVSLFISDMRVLKNICNEYFIYRSALNQSGILQDKLFAIIVYKNIYPKDFSDLLNNEGHLSNLFNLKQHLISIHKSEYEKQLEDLEKVVAFIESDTVESLDELVITHLRKMNNLNTSHSIELAGTNYSINDSKSMADFLKKLLELSPNEPPLKIQTGRHNPPSISFKDFCTAKNTSPDILIRAKAIVIRDEDKVPITKSKIKELKKFISELNTSSFSEVIRKPHALIDEHLKERDLLRVLILQGWIDEDYDEYITYFYEGSMFKEDVNFLKSVRLSNPKGFDYKLKNINEVQKKLSKEHFYSPAILNYDLLSFLLNAVEDESIQKRNYLIDYISNDLIENFSFVLDFLEKYNMDLTPKVKVLIHDLVERNENLWDKMFGSFKDKSQEIKFIQLLIFTVTLSELKKLNGFDSLSHYIEQSREFLSWWSENELDDDIEKLRLTLEILEVQFSDLQYVEDSADIIDLIIENNFYKLKKEVLSTLLYNFETINYEVIHSQNSIMMKRRIEDEIGVFVSEILLDQFSYNETEDMFINLLNHENLDKELKLELLEKWEGTIRDLKEVESIELYSKILEENKIEVSWLNIRTYYSTLEVDEELQILEDFITISSNFDNLIKETEEVNIQEIEEACFQDVIKLVIESDEVSDGKINDFLANVDQHISIDSPSEISEGRYMMLLEMKLLSWQENILEHLYETSATLATMYFHLIREFLSDEEIESLISNQKLPWDKNIYFYFNEKEDEPFAYNYLISFEEQQFIGKLIEIECDSLLYAEILKDENVMAETKLRMINNFKQLKVKFNPEIISWLLNRFKEEGFKIISDTLERKIIEEDFLMSLRDQENIALILFGSIEKYQYKKRKIYNLLSELPEPFSLLIIPNKRNTEFLYSTPMTKLLNKLDSMDVIASFSEREGLLYVNNKRQIR